ncbi:hypothetical protein CH063_14487 [Colletotrichum higginsianum]|uniref:Uncharacterized protein n=1 Tax=Colletotrichum higginsianum (strain IMI 349063) TaxID=759273 RepID=H1VYS2_COLHI|nr:hypothetical protein CH063_14487 [Colletotrichum higginsianum]
MASRCRKSVECGPRRYWNPPPSPTPSRSRWRRPPHEHLEESPKEYLKTNNHHSGISVELDHNLNFFFLYIIAIEACSFTQIYCQRGSRGVCLRHANLNVTVPSKPPPLGQPILLLGACNPRDLC